MDSLEGIEYVVGEEKRLSDVVSSSEVLPLLQSAVASGIRCAEVVDEHGVTLWFSGEQSTWVSSTQKRSHKMSLLLEGEPVGELRMLGETVDPILLESSTQLVGRTLNTLITSNLKRMLTTEIHTQVINQSYQELVDANQNLSASEKKYRDLAENLEQRVQQRTKELKQMYGRLIQQEKMASIGQMAAGVAHEINNPLGFILSNLNSLQRFHGRYQEMLDFYRNQCRAQSEYASLERLAEVEYKRLKLAFISEEMQDVFEESISGAERVKKIVADLKGFSHIDTLGEDLLDIQLAIEQTLNVLAHEIPVGTNIQQDYGELPAYLCTGGLFSQLLFNLLRNAIQSRNQELELFIRAKWDSGTFTLTIADNGPGIAVDVLPRIFEPFFTTREVGQGTGLGLSVAYDIVTNWEGQISATNRPQGGASFTVTLPEKRLNV